MTWAAGRGPVGEKRTYRKFTATQKAEIVLAGLREDRSVRDVCRQHRIAETLYYSWRDKLLEGGKIALNGKDERQAELELRKRIAELERARSTGRIQTKPEEIELFARSLGKNDRVALEVTGNAREIARIIEPYVARGWDGLRDGRGSLQCCHRSVRRADGRVPAQGA